MYIFESICYNQSIRTPEEIRAEIRTLTHEQLLAFTLGLVGVGLWTDPQGVEELLDEVTQTHPTPNLDEHPAHEQPTQNRGWRSIFPRRFKG